jgi:hypothetical protein
MKGIIETIARRLFVHIIILRISNSMLLYTYYIISLRMLFHIVNYCIQTPFDEITLMCDLYKTNIVSWILILLAR